DHDRGPRTRDLAMAENAERPSPATDNDTPWKNALEHHFPEFIAFYFPGAHAGIDWSTRWSSFSTTRPVWKPCSPTPTPSPSSPPRICSPARPKATPNGDMRQNGALPGYSMNGTGTVKGSSTCSPSSTG
ncbi:MAG TPA: hypothetical protein VES73_16110, partial [Lamprocystis sp. (in: g-proteobacteria)]|nr:hypothetical protein [Lamprocystis sp. (in: g-proteobacteria)]